MKIVYTKCGVSFISQIDPDSRIALDLLCAGLIVRYQFKQEKTILKDVQYKRVLSVEELTIPQIIEAVEDEKEKLFDIAPFMRSVH